MCANARTLQLFHVLFVFLSITAAALEDNGVVIRCLERERNALLHLKQGFSDDYNRLSSWSGEECCKWQGVECSNLTGNILTLDLKDLALGGKVTFSSLVELHHLTYLDLSSNYFFPSQIPELIGSLKELQYLDLSWSFLNGTIPHQIGNLSHLQTLNLGYNYFDNVENLEWLSNLRAIRYLDLSEINLNNTNWVQPIQKLSFLTELHLWDCSIRSPLPSFTNSSYMPLLSVIDLSSNDCDSLIFHWLYNLSSSLVDLDISSNSLLGGPIPDVFSNMIHLENLNLYGCNFDGMIPDSLGNLTRLRSLYLSENSLTGNLSEFFINWSGGAKNSIKFLDLSSNELSGSLPGQFSFPNLEILDLSNNTIKGRLPESIGQCSKLITLDVSLNSFEGTITEIHFMKLSKLQFLRLSFNSLVFDVSSDWDPPFELNVIVLDNCNLGPNFPKWLQTQNKFYQLQMPNASISDAVPNWFWSISPGLVYLNLASNQLSGVIPDWSSRFTQLLSIDLRSNQFSGPLPLVPPTVESLYLSKNRFVGSISSLCDRASIADLDLSNNLLSGELPRCWKQNDQLKILNLANNNFTGKIPTSFRFPNLQSLHLRNNNFTGELPSSLKYCRMLRVVDLGGNKFSGRFPEWIGVYLRELLVLSLSLNELYGNIPPNICSLNQIQVLDLSQNRLSGNVPSCLNNFTSLNRTGGLVMIPSSTSYFYDGMDRGYFEHAVVQWKGQSAEYGRKILELLKVIDLSSNKLTGQIPDELASLIDLRSLNLSRNFFRGHIPEKIGQMKMLESLDLSRNLLSGQIPLGLGTVASLSVLDLSNNDLSGKIPLGTQLQGFNSSVYSGNHQLCGLPLPKKCPGEGIAPTSKDKDAKEDDGDDEVITTGFYVSLVLGFAFGFWGVFRTLQLKQSWRRALFQFLSDKKDKVYVAAAVNMAKIKRMRTG